MQIRMQIRTCRRPLTLICNLKAQLHWRTVQTLTKFVKLAYMYVMVIYSSSAIRVNIVKISSDNTLATQRQNKFVKLAIGIYRHF
jgi:hypothetical protein